MAAGAQPDLRGVLDSVGDAIITADGESTIVGWNGAASAMFGWSAEEALGSELTMLMPERYREGHLRGLGRLVETGVPHLVGHGTVELDALRRDGTEFPIELTLGAFQGASGDLFTGVVRDLSDRRLLEAYRRAQVSVTTALAASATFGEAATGVLRALGGAVGWPLGGLWLVDEEAGVLRCAAVWHAESAPAEDFERLSTDSFFSRGTGLPGRVWESGEAAWIDDVANDENFPRVRAAAAAGLHAAVGLPLLADGAVIGVLEFFDREVRHPTPDVQALIRSLTEHVGQYLQRHRAEDRLAGAEVELERRRAAQRHAQEINAHVINHLVQASEALDAGDLRRAQAEMRRTLEEASRIVTDLGLPSS